MAEDQNQNAPLQSDQTDLKSDAQDNGQSDPSDKLTPDHPRFKEVLQRAKEAEEKASQFEEKLAELQEQISARQERTGDDELSEEEERALERIAKGLKEKGLFASPEDLRAEKRSLTFDKLSDKYDGKNGYPKFNAAEVAAFARKSGYGDNFEAAYKEMHWDAILKVEANREGARPPSSEKPGGREPEAPEKTVSPEDIANMSDEEYEKHRLSIQGALRSGPR